MLPSDMLNTGVLPLQKKNQEQITSKPSIKCTGVHSQEIGPTPFLPHLLIKKILLVHFSEWSYKFCLWSVLHPSATPCTASILSPNSTLQTGLFPPQKSHSLIFWRLLSSPAFHPPAAASGTLIPHCGFLTTVSQNHNLFSHVALPQGHC